MFIIWSLLFIFFAIYLVVWLYQNKIIGAIGERFSASEIRRYVKGKVFHDIYVKGSHGVQQIDILAVTEKGVLVIEKKTWIGRVLGGEFANTWTVYCGRGKNQKSYKTKNPLHQNFGHLQALQEQIPEMEGKCLSIVLFGNNARLTGKNTQKNVIRDADFKRYYQSLPSILTVPEVDDFAERIRRSKMTQKELKTLHRKKIKAIKKQSK